MNDSTAVPDGADCWTEVIRAYQSMSWVRLGYRSWGTYMAGEWNLGEIRRLEPKEQAKIAAVLFAAEMPARDVAAALGVRVASRTRTPRERLDPSQRPTGGGRIYVIGSDEFRPVKIGTGNPENRLVELQVGNPFPLKILWTRTGGMLLEAALHARFADFRVRGEWFDFPAPVDPVHVVSRTAEVLAPMVGTMH